MIAITTTITIIITIITTITTVSFHNFKSHKFQIERLKSQQQICCLLVRTVSNVKLPGSRPQKQTSQFEN